MNKITIVFKSFPDYSGNARSLYDYMDKRFKGKLNLVWLVDNKIVFDKLKKQKKNVFLDTNDSRKEIINTATILFDTHGQFCEEETSNKLYINLWHGMPIKK
jgi:CDP-glycerol glycerophosphotransferase (TagB/SpsB family)